jgi:tRNA U34 5-carboxymethylaminomethyl modifying enzyme MnmG/GidA
MTEVTTTETPKPTNEELAAEFVQNNSVNEVINRIAHLMRSVENTRSDYEQARKSLLHWKENTTEFIIDFVKSDDITTDDLKEFAEKMNIELTKEIEVTFKVDVKFTATVPLDFDVDKIDESDFDVRVDYRGNDDDIEMNEEYVDTEDFEVSDDN